MHPHTGHADVCRDGEVGQPKVLNLVVVEDLLDECVEGKAGHHAGVGVGQVEHHPPLLGHFFAEAASL